MKPWIGLLSKGTDISTTCAVVIFRAKVSCDTLTSWWYYMIQHTLTLKMLPQRLLKRPSLSTTVLFKIYSPWWSYSTHLWNDSWVQTFQCVKMMHFVSNLLSASIDHLRRCLVLITKFIHLVVKAFDHWCIVFNVFFNDLLKIKSLTDYKGIRSTYLFGMRFAWRLNTEGDSISRYNLHTARLTWSMIM